jgi:hypothetical protein
VSTGGSSMRVCRLTKYLQNENTSTPYYASDQV